MPYYYVNRNAQDDGYHEVRTVLQAVGLADTLTFAPSSDLTLSVSPRNAAPAATHCTISPSRRR